MSSSPKHILITGAGGFIGTALLKSLSQSHTISGIESSGGKDLIACDISDFNAAKKILDQKKPIDVIIHLASVMASAGNLEDINVLNQNNTLSYNVSKLALELNCKKLINFSSSSVYPNIDGTFSEDSTIDPSENPDAIYGLSKYNSEVILNKICAGKNITLTHLRSVMAYGPGVNPTRIWPVMEQELKEKNTITVFGNGKRLINQVHLNYLEKVVANFIEKDLPGIYNVSEETISLYDLAARMISEKGNKESAIIKVEKGNSFQFRVDASKLKKVL